MPTPIPESAAIKATHSESMIIIDGGTFLDLGADPLTLDSHLNADATSAGQTVEVFGGLMTIDRNLAIAGDLTESWDVSSDGTETTFHLRPSAKFHDGRGVTTSDIKWSLEWVADPVTGSFNASAFLNDIVSVQERLEGAVTVISGVQVFDDRTVIFTSDAPKPYFLSKLTYPVSCVLDQENAESGSYWSLEPNGTGLSAGRIPL